MAETISGKRSARLAALFAAVSPVAFTVWSIKTRGGFIEVIVIGALSFLILLRGIKYQQLNAWRLALVAALLGLGWWVNNQIIYFMLPIFLVTLGYCVREYPLLRTIKYFLICIASFLFGSLPFWIYNIKNEYKSFEIFNSASEGKFADYASGFFDTSLPILLGARKFWTFTDNFPAASIIVFSLYALLLATFLILEWRSFARIFTLKFDQDNSSSILVLFLLTIFLVFTGSSFGHLAEAPRYLLPAYLAIFILVGVTCSRLFAINRLLGSLIAGLLLLVNILSCYFPQRQLLGEPFVYQQQRVSPDNSELLRWLEKNQYDFVKTNYWVGYRLAFESNLSLIHI